MSSSELQPNRPIREDLVLMLDGYRKYFHLSPAEDAITAAQRQPSHEKITRFIIKTNLAQGHHMWPCGGGSAWERGRGRGREGRDGEGRGGTGRDGEGQGGICLHAI